MAWGQTLEKQYSKAELLYDSDLVKEAKLQLNEIINIDGNEKIVNESLLLLGKIIILIQSISHLKLLGKIVRL